MASYTDPPEDGRGRRDLSVAVVFLVLAVLFLYLPPGTQGQVAERYLKHIASFQFRDK